MPFGIMGWGRKDLSFMIATESAYKNPSQKTVVIDMCPQANVSEILLGGNGKGTAEISNRLAQRDGRTIGGYFDKRLSNPGSKTGAEADYLIDARTINDSMPENFYLIFGITSSVHQSNYFNILTEQAFENVHTWVSDIKDAIGSRCIIT